MKIYDTLTEEQVDNIKRIVDNFLQVDGPQRTVYHMEIGRDKYSIHHKVSRYVVTDPLNCHKILAVFRRFSDLLKWFTERRNEFERTKYEMKFAATVLMKKLKDAGFEPKHDEYYYNGGYHIQVNNRVSVNIFDENITVYSQMPSKSFYGFGFDSVSAAFKYVCKVHKEK